MKSEFRWIWLPAMVLIALGRARRCLTAAKVGSPARVAYGGMTLKESEQMFRNLAYQDPGNARQQAARGSFDPAYLNYTLGKLMIRKLHEEWTASRGGRKAWRAFHDTFLSLWRTADSARSEGHARTQCRATPLMGI